MPPKKSKAKKVSSTGSVLCDNGDKPSVVAASGRRYCVDAKGSRKYIDPVAASNKKKRPSTPTKKPATPKKKPATPKKKPATPKKPRRGSTSTAAAKKQDEPKKVVLTGPAFCAARDKFTDESKREYCLDDNGDPVFTGRRNVPVQEKPLTKKSREPVVVHVHVPKQRAPSPAPAPAPAKEKIVHVPKIKIVRVPVPVHANPVPEFEFEPEQPKPVARTSSPVFRAPAPVLQPRQPTPPAWPKSLAPAPKAVPAPQTIAFAPQPIAFAPQPQTMAFAPAKAPKAAAPVERVVRFNSQPQVQEFTVNTSDFQSSSDTAEDVEELLAQSNDDDVIFPEIEPDVRPPGAPPAPPLPEQLPNKPYRAPPEDDRWFYQRWLSYLGGGDAPEVKAKTKAD